MDKKLKAQAEAMGIKVDARWSDKTLQDTIDVLKPFHDSLAPSTQLNDPRNQMQAPTIATTVVEPGGGGGAPAPPVPEGERMFPVRLLKHYQPRFWKEGRYNVISAALPPLPGVGFDGKLWAGTVVELPVEEAKGLLEHTITTLEKRKVDDRIVKENITRKFPLAERADALPV